MSGGDDRDPSKTAVKASSAAILARILVMNTNFLAQLTSDPSLAQLLQQAGIPVEENILLGLVDIWLDKVRYLNALLLKEIQILLSLLTSLRPPSLLYNVVELGLMFSCVFCNKKKKGNLYT